MSPLLLILLVCQIFAETISAKGALMGRHNPQCIEIHVSIQREWLFYPTSEFFGKFSNEFLKKITTIRANQLLTGFDDPIGNGPIQLFVKKPVFASHSNDSVVFLNLFQVCDTTGLVEPVESWLITEEIN